MVRNLPDKCGDAGSIPESVRSPGGGNDSLVQYPCLENSTDRGAWQASVHGVREGRTRQSDRGRQRETQRDRGTETERWTDREGRNPADTNTNSSPLRSEGNTGGTWQTEAGQGRSRDPTFLRPRRNNRQAAGRGETVRSQEKAACLTWACQEGEEEGQGQKPNNETKVQNADGGTQPSLCTGGGWAGVPMAAGGLSAGCHFLQSLPSTAFEIRSTWVENGLFQVHGNVRIALHNSE